VSEPQGAQGRRRQSLLSSIDASRPLVEEIARTLYDRPELGLAEHFASARLKEVLSAHGFAVQDNLAGMPTAFEARAGKGRPALAFMAEYDALPAIGHGCGHNLIAACAVSAGIACKQALSDELPDTSWVVFGTPAEETVGGKVAMAEAGVFNDIDAAFIAHPGQRNSLGGTSWSSHPIEMTFHGRASHAGGNPQEGINALDALVTAYMSIRSLRNHLREDARIAGIITHGGDAQNIVPDRTVVRFTVRARDWRYLETVVLPKVRQCALGAAQAHGATVEFRHHEPLFKETLEHPVLKQLAAANFASLGEEVPPLPEGSGGGTTDVGSVAWVTPCVQIGFKIAGARGHSREMADATLTRLAIDKTLMAAKVLALSALDLVERPELLAEAKKHLHVAQKGM